MKTDISHYEIRFVVFYLYFTTSSLYHFEIYKLEGIEMVNVAPLSGSETTVIVPL